MCKFVKLDLSNFFNHKLIGEESVVKSNTSLKNISINNSFFIPDSLPVTGEEIIFQNIPFDFPDKSFAHYDNLTCEEQSIDIPVEKYCAINILGLCESGSYSEEINLKFSDCSVEQTTVFLYDWFTDNFFTFALEEENCHLVLKAPISSLYKCGIYSYRCIINSSLKQLCTIQLPFNPNMHIFSITLEKN
jgi:hypothetical protein